MKGKILVVGATGSVGKQIVRKLDESGSPFRLLVRDIGRAKRILGDQYELVLGDVRIPQTLSIACKGVQSVICSIGTRFPLDDENNPEKVDFEGVANLVDAAEIAGVEQFVLVSSIAVTKPDHPLNKFGRVLDWKLQGENYLRKSGLNYTIVRPGGLTDEPGGRYGLQVDQGDRITGRICREDVAEICVQALQISSARNVTFEVVNTSQTASIDLSQLFQRLKPDTIRTLS